MLENIAKRFKNEWIFKNLNYTFEKNTKYAIVGHNGSGKSTFLSVVTGINPPSRGNVNYFVEGKAIDGDDIYAHITFAAPYMELIEELTLNEIIELQQKFRPFVDGMGHQVFLQKVKLEQHQNKPISQFSSGMKQRLKLGLALFFKSGCVFLDEPTSNLDEFGVEWYLENVQSYVKDRILIISSNNKTEYNFCEEQIDITNFKK